MRPWSPAPPGSTPSAMSGDCPCSAETTAHVSASNPYLARVYPTSLTACRATPAKSPVQVVVTSPASTMRPVVTSVSHATPAAGVLVQHGIEHGVGHLVRDLVRMPLGYRLRREHVTSCTAHMRR